MSTAHDGLDELRADLRAEAAGLAEALLGPPSKAHSTCNTLRWGSKGGLALDIRGPKTGLWYDHDATIGGSGLELIRHVRRCDRDDAVAWGRSWLGIPEPERRSARPHARPAAAARDDDPNAKQDAARRLWEAAVPIAGTPAERYLTETRRIPRPAGGWPADAMRWHPGVLAWLIASRDPAGDMVGIQRVFLTPDGQNVRGADGGRIKRSLGPVSDGIARLPGRWPGTSHQKSCCAEMLGRREAALDPA